MTGIWKVMGSTPVEGSDNVSVAIVVVAVIMRLLLFVFFPVVIDGFE